MNPILSIIVISHEQREEMKRCVDSILAMHLPFPFEMILSDDCSTDGTFILAKSYADSLVKFQQENINLTRIVATQCNSNEGGCINNSQRSGYNRCNGYRYAQGKYIAHVDGDDYFRPLATAYIKEVEALEAHPECAIAMGDCWLLEEGKSFNEGRRYGFCRPMIDGEIISASQYIREGLFIVNPVMIQRRNPEVNPVELYGNRYVDYVTTLHHLQFGSIIYVDVCDYIYVQHANSIVHQLETQNKDMEVMWNMGIYIPALIPRWTTDMYMGHYYSAIKKNIQLADSGYQLSKQNYESLKSMNLWIYNCFSRKLKCIDHIRLNITLLWIRFVKRTGLENSLFIWILNTLLTKEWHRYE